ncbi:uncharacterized protein J3D65DRAFT_615574 [Phyllosticta citribraziliensis]|uniref:Anaphase-promoting complex subunit 2 n=1 Tax=Phyllosticta citribraziliensis TaxID=989973 RepID=A0ABR1LZ69_9PEZI
MAAAIHDNRSLIFASVFPLPSKSNPSHALTHAAATDHGVGVVTRSHDHQHHRPGNSSSGRSSHPLNRNVAWNTATRFLKLPVPLPTDVVSRARSRKHRVPADVDEALKYLIRSGNDGQAALLDWYLDEARDNFVACVRPALRDLWDAPIPTARALPVLQETVKLLKNAQSQYVPPLQDHLVPIIKNTSGADRALRASTKFKRELHTTFLHALPQQRFTKTLAHVLLDVGCHLFDLQDSFPKDAARENGQRLRQSVTKLLRELHDVGLGRDCAQRAVAHAMDRLMDSFIGSHYMKVDWYGRRSVTKNLKEWIRDGFAPLVNDLMSSLTCGEETIETNIHQWTEMAIGRLGRARVDNLFDYVVNWDSSLGAILDLREYISTPAARNHLTHSFLQQLARRLLHAGATTTHILDTYIYVIRAFVELDPKGILLEKVARPIRRYLRDREDTASIIVSSLLAEIVDEDGNRIDPGQEISVEIATEMLNPMTSGSEELDIELDWGNMNWVPDPVDASTEYRKSKSENVLGYLLTLYDKDDFISELKTIWGEHLLRSESVDFEKEIRLLEFFKVRLGENNLQACEVMLRDVLESKRINKQIHQTLLQTAAGTNKSHDIQVNSHILSAFFWPSLREDEFPLPGPVQSALQDYAAGFEAIKDMRKLHWLPALGRVSISLDFADRHLDLEVTPWQAAVIHAFNEDDVDSSQSRPVTKTVDELEAVLELDETLLRSALIFWVAQLVLTESTPNTYTVLESLSDAPSSSTTAAAAAAAAAAAEEQASAVKRAEDILVDNMAMYRQFVMGMLTNQGRMSAERVQAMLKRALMGGFPFGVEEVGVLLSRMVEEEVLVRAGDEFSVKK